MQDDLAVSVGDARVEQQIGVGFGQFIEPSGLMRRYCRTVGWEAEYEVGRLPGGFLVGGSRVIPRCGSGIVLPWLC
ncbi:hypothetical protein [Actinomadura sp. NPDC048394]|uniref:hypothetical protein n=1 Tax=Actinomadura sp. NPDC048394 TaxID=3158223 RepID=UPI0033D39AD9